MSACGSLTSEVLGLISATADIAAGTATNASFIDSLETLTGQINLGTKKLAFVQTDGLSAGTLSAGMPDVAGETSGATTHINASGWVGIQYDNNTNEKAPLHVNAKNNHKDHIVVFESRASNPDGGTLFTNNKWTLDNNFNQFTSGSITAGGTVSALAVCAETIHSNTFTYNSTTGTNITSTAEVVEIAGSVSITGDTLDPIAQHAFRVIPNGNSNSATKYFLITTGGQVGIGTNTVPTGVDLHATGAISAQTVCAGTLDVATFKFNNTINAPGVSAGALTAGALTNTASDSFPTMISSSGWLGIQTSNPHAPLHIDYFNPNSTTSTVVRIDKRTVGGDLGNDHDNLVAIYANGSMALNNNLTAATLVGTSITAMGISSEGIAFADLAASAAGNAAGTGVNASAIASLESATATLGGGAGATANLAIESLESATAGMADGTILQTKVRAKVLTALSAYIGNLTSSAENTNPTVINTSGWIGVQNPPSAPLDVDAYGIPEGQPTVKFRSTNAAGGFEQIESNFTLYRGKGGVFFQTLSAQAGLSAMGGISSQGIAFADIATSAAGNAAGTATNASAIGSLESATATLAGATANAAFDSLESATAHLASLTSGYASSADFNSVATDISTLQDEMNGVEAGTGTNASAISSLESATAALNTKDTALAAGTGTNASAISSLQSATAALDAARLALSASTISSNLDTAEGAIDSLESATAALNALISSNAGALVTAANNIDSLESATAGLAGATANAAFDSLESATGHLASLTSGYASSADFSSLAVDISTLQDEMNGVEAGTGTNASAIGSLESATATLAGASANSAIDSLESATAALDAARLALSAGTISSNLDTAEGAIDSLESATATLNTKDTALAAGTGTNASAIGSLESATAALNAARLALSADTISSAVNSLKSATADMADGTTLQDEVRTKSLSSLSSHVGGVHNHTLGRYPTLINLSGYVGVQTNFPESPLHINGMNLKGSDRLVTIEARYATAMTTNQFRDLVIVTTAGNIEVKGTISGNHLKGNTLSSDGISLAQLITSADANAAGTGTNASAIGSLESATGVLSTSSIANAAGTGTNASAIGSLESATAALNTKDTALAAGTGTNASAIGSLESATGVLSTSSIANAAGTATNAANITSLIAATGHLASMTASLKSDVDDLEDSGIVTANAVDSLESATAKINNATSTAVLYADDYSVSGSSGASTFATVSPVGDVVKMGFGASIPGGLVYLDPITKEWKGCNMNGGGSGASALVGIALGTSPSSDGVLIRGRVTLATSFCVNFSDTDFGSIFYIAQNGKVSPDAPNSSGQYVRALGYIIDPGVNKTVYFNPSKTFIRVR